MTAASETRLTGQASQTGGVPAGVRRLASVFLLAVVAEVAVVVGVPLRDTIAIPADVGPVDPRIAGLLLWLVVGGATLAAIKAGWIH